MQWKEIREHYPQQWLLVEAIKAHTEEDKRILDNLSVLNIYSDSTAAMKEYMQLHHETPEREVYILHTSRERLDIVERRWLGVQAA